PAADARRASSRVRLDRRWACSPAAARSAGVGRGRWAGRRRGAADRRGYNGAKRRRRPPGTPPPTPPPPGRTPPPVRAPAPHPPRPPPPPIDPPLNPRHHHRMRTHLNQHPITITQHPPHRIREPNRLAQIGNPVTGIQLTGPGTGDRGVERGMPAGGL